MSDKKPGFFKRLLGSLLGGDKPAPEAEAAEAPAAGTGGEAPAARPEPQAEREAPARPEDKPVAKPEDKPKAEKPPKAEERPAQPGAEKAKAARPKAGKTGKPKAEKPKPAPKPAPKVAPKSAPKSAGAKPQAVEPDPAPKPEPKARTKPKPQAGAAPEADTRPVPAAKPARAAEPGPAPEPQAPVEEPPVPEPVSEPAPEPLAPAPAAREQPPAAPPQAEEEQPQKKGWFSRLRDGLSKTSNALTDNIAGIFTRRKLDAATLQELEDALIQADLGVDMAMRITAEVARGRFDKEIAPEEVRAVLGAEVAGVLEPVARPLEIETANRPHVILVVGVNGSGKTTTIGKLANQYRNAGKSVVLAAGDTFRAAAIDQLKIWGERTGAPVVARNVGSDAAGLAFDALTLAREQEADVLLIDTAGRLQNKADLMAELAKVVRVLKKIDETAPHSVLLVLDATTGQNAVRQVEVFSEIAGVTGLIMTKLDGTARGGILVAIAEKFALPVHAIGVGEGIEDLQPFDAYEFAALIAGARERVDA
ncbi:MAG: signal recognition particle-docking protein FtsY [Hyphomicrobiales bacterium]